MATMIADELRVRGVVVLGYPFHPPGQPEKLRTAHLETMQTRTLIVQGTRDPFGTAEEVAAYPISPAIRIEWLPGQHSLAGAQLAKAIELTANFVIALT
jgi:predicted alpha/beta-hydrolase family hydrolase